jgi:hypothetical protein
MKPGVESLLKIVAAGGGIMIDASQFKTSQLVRIVRAASRCRSTVILKNAGAKEIAQLLEIAEASTGCVIFDLL